MIFQLGSALLDACVLAILDKEDTYGYRLTQEVKTLMDVSESTLYPVLRRLMRDGFLETYDQEHMGRNRRYYRLTSSGKEKLENYKRDWKEFQLKISNILEGEKQDEQG